MPEQLYVASAGPAAPKPPVTYRPARAAARPAARRAAPGRAPGRRRTVELPPLPRVADSRQTVLQPQFSADLLPSRSLQLPELFFWAARAFASAAVKPVVTPGLETPAPSAARLDAEPRLAVPVPDIGQLLLAGMSATATLLGPLPSLPVRTAHGEEAAQTGSSADALRGDASTVLSLSADPLPLREYLTVPPGNQLGDTPGTLTSGAGGTRGHTDSGSGTNGPGAQESPGAASAMPEAALPSAQGNAADTALDPASPLSRPPLSAAVEATRILHPVNGVFDIVVQSAGVDGFPESAGVLTGRPVYSVYLAVGSVKDWILQYCVPAADAQELPVNGPVVRLGVPSALSAPFPRVTMRPLIYRRAGSYLMLHGIIDTNGRFQDLRVLGVNDTLESANVLAVLEQWEFRPASQDGRPVRVEVLVAIPSE